MRALSDQAQQSVQSLKLSVRLGACNIRPHNGQLLQGCIRSSPLSPPATLASLRTCAQGTAAATARPLGSTLGPRPRLRPGLSEPLRRSVSWMSGLEQSRLRRQLISQCLDAHVKICVTGLQALLTDFQWDVIVIASRAILYLHKQWLEDERSSILCYTPNWEHEMLCWDLLILRKEKFKYKKE
ncbi:hypothetical protein NDU88_006091 [Pleurodeles waltl]|uniref:Uncharacterized protein n=1 Tax=Pleurodeles waltl TaxID=8319 RepID=A0AAV7TD65_PLEWA|nr:hypothetical protein NDU88_006091 [Pleurodeles waltl]